MLSTWGTLTMTIFRSFLVAVFITLCAYTMAVIANHGLGLFSIFFEDISKLGWPGQFNADFLSMLALSALWVAWRNRFSPAGLGLATLAFFGGAPFLCVYLFVLSIKTKGDVRHMLAGEN